MLKGGCEAVLIRPRCDAACPHLGARIDHMRRLKAHLELRCELRPHVKKMSMAHSVPRPTAIVRRQHC